MQIVGLANTKDEISAYLKLGTNGNNMSLMLLRAYMSWRNFTFGEKLTLLQDCYACQPPTIDPEGPSGCVSNVAYEISYTRPVTADSVTPSVWTCRHIIPQAASTEAMTFRNSTAHR